MKAAVVREFKQPVVIEDRPVPEPGDGQVLVKIEASGLCHTDMHAANGDWPVKPTLPFVPGHEGVGIVQRVGRGVTRVAEGDRVAIPWLGWACGECEYCMTGWETLCERQQNSGYSVDGGWAEYALASAGYVGKVPSGMDPFEAAPLTCAGVTTYKAVKVSGTRPSDLVAIFGVGGLGHLALQYALIAGAQVVAVDLFDEKLAMAKELGAAYTVNARQEDPAAAIKALGGAGGHLARRLPQGVRAGIWLAPEGRHPGLRRAARGQPPSAVHLRDRAERDEGPRLDRQHQDRPAGGLRTARGGQDPCGLRAAPARGRQLRDPRSGDRAGEGQARL